MPTGLASQQEDIPLVGVMSEFHVALREEIEPSQRKASSDAIPLVNGRRAAQVGGRYLFTFEIESALKASSDAIPLVNGRRAAQVGGVSIHL